MKTLSTFLRNQAQCVKDIRASVLAHTPEVETFNGPGSTLTFTGPLREQFPVVLAELGIGVLLDAPCGDGNWSHTLDLGDITYIGVDIEPSILAAARARRPDGQFHLDNILTTNHPLPAADMILCRDFLIHLPNEAIVWLLGKFRATGARYLATTYSPSADNRDPAPLDGGDRWPGYFERAINLERDPFGLPPHLVSIPDPIALPPWEDKCLAVYQL